MLKNILNVLMGLAAALLLGRIAVGDDTDIYLNPGSNLPPGSEPMVVFSLDYRPNLGATACNGDECAELISEGYLPANGPYSYFDVLRAVLKKVMEPLQGVRVGLMLNHNNDTNCDGPRRSGCSNGGYIAMGFEPFLRPDATDPAKQKFHEILANIPTPQGNQSHSYQGKELYFELYRYLTGQSIYNAHNGWTDYATSQAQNLDTDDPGALIAWDPAIESGGSYVSPLSAAGACTNIFAVNFLFFVSSQDKDSDEAIAAPVAEGGFGSPQADFANVVRYMHDADLASGELSTVPNLPDKQNVTSYFLVDPTKINRTTISYAAAGGTGQPLPLSANPQDLINTLNEIFKQILSISTTFVAASVPVNVFNRAEIIDNVYIALFQVDADLRPSWPGNVKKLRLGSIDGSTLLVDALGSPAVAGDGRIRFDALTYWTLPNSLPPPDTAAGEVAGRDGRSVSRGGAGQKIPGVLGISPGLLNAPGARQVFYDRSTASLAPLNADAATALDVQSDLGAADAAEAEELLMFARGLDVDDADGDGNTTEARRWTFGDPLHSRPLPLNYGARDGHTASNPAIYVAVASNDGFLHFIRNTTSGGAESGVEAWAFMPRAAMAAQRALRTNASGWPHPYTVDGSPVAYFEDTNHNGTIETGEKAYLYFGMRRGGKAYYALDVSDPNSPRLMWTIEKGGSFAELGYTFSDPRVGMIDSGNGPRPALFLAGGYDMNKDLRGGVGTDDSEGNALFVVDAVTGALLWKARGGGSAATSTVFEHPELVDSISSTPTVADTDGDLLIDRILVGDTGGNIWRADLPGSNTSNWRLTLLAKLGRHGSTAGGKADDRRFFHRPDLVPSQDVNGLFDAVLIGSGDRPDPLDQGGVVENFFYMIKDRSVAKGSAVDRRLEHHQLGDVTDNCMQEGSSCSVDLTNGWRLELERTGEKVLSTPVTIAGQVFFTSYVPAGGAATGTCSPSEGSGRLYAVGLRDARSVINYDTTDDDPNYVGVPTSKSDRSTELHAPGIPAEIVSLPPDQILRPDLQIDTLDTQTRWRTFWYLREDSDL